MQLTILGSGTCIPSLKRSASAYLLKIGKDNVLIDSGSGTLRQMERIRFDYINLDCLIYTHLHPDHVTDLSAIIQALLVRTVYIGFKRKKPLYIIGPQGFKKYFKETMKFQLSSLDSLPFSLKILEIKNKIKFIGWQIKASKVIHRKESLAYRFETKDKSFVYSGDTGYCQSIIQLARNCDLLVLESSYPDHYGIAGHLTSSEAGDIATKADVKKLVLTHFYPICDKFDLKKQAQKRFKGSIILAKDLMKIEI